LVIGRICFCAAGESGCDLDNTGQILEDSIHAPEATSAECCGLY
jgi:hypothetical protein